MKLYLFGGAEIQPNQVPCLKKLIKETIVSLRPKQVFHIPFSRLHSTEEDWKEGWFKKTMNDTGIELLDARNEKDIQKANKPLIFINGGHGRYDLLYGVKNNQKILQLVLVADFIVAESAGSMLMGERQSRSRDKNEIIEGLGILKNTIIEPHYSERNYQQLLKQEMEKSGMKYGIGIDCLTAIVVDPKEFPSKWGKIGAGNVEIVVSEN
ncbi:MAG: Type 1 glutamine amidotransferase-like domain-containing protein [bacterium]|nr:Type 1 glutamine amidotransferase-like domain-containing protein [bacterium]